MTIRIAAGSVALILSALVIGLFLAPESHARGGGFGGHAMPFHGGRAFHPVVRAPMVRPSATAASPVARAAPLRTGRFARFRHRRFIGGGWPATAWWGDTSYGGYYSPSDAAATYEQPVYPPSDYPPADAPVVRERVIYVVPFRPGCRTQTYKVPAESGGKHSINVVRC